MNKKVPDHYVQIILGILVLIFLFLCFLLVRQYNHTARVELMSLYRSRISSLGHPLTVSDLSLIQPWMTFDYINVTFKIPPDVFKSSLVITDSRYPRLSLSRYAKEASTTPEAVITEVQTIARNFLATKK